MVILIALIIIWTSYAVRLHRAQQAGATNPDHSPAVSASPKNGVQNQRSGHDPTLWTVLDDRQLTRLLTDSAPRSTNEQDPA